MELGLDRDGPSNDERALRLEQERTRELGRELELQQETISLDRGLEKVDALSDMSLQCLSETELDFIKCEISEFAFIKTGSSANIQELEYDPDRNLVLARCNGRSLQVELDKEGFEKPIEVREKLSELQTLEQVHQQLEKNVGHLADMVRIAIDQHNKDALLQEIKIEQASQGLMGVWNKLTGQIPEPYPSLYEKPLTHDDLARSLLIADVKTESFQQLLDNQMSDIRRYPQQIDEQLDRVVEQSRNYLEAAKLETAAMVAGYELERTTKQPEIESQLERSIEEHPITDERQQDARQEDLNPTLNLDDRELSRQEKLELSHEKIDDIREIYVNRIHEVNQELSDINTARQVEGYWEQSQEIIQADTDRADLLLSQRLNLYEILDRTPDEQQAYLDQHPEFDLVLNERDYDKVQVVLDDLSENMPKPITLENNPDDYKVGVWDSVTESINDTLQQSDDAIRESLKVEAADDSFFADMKRNAAAGLALVEGGYELGKETIEGLWDLTVHSVIGVGTGYTGLADAITGGYLSENFDFVQHANEYNVQAHTLATNIAETTMPILADVQLSQEGFSEATDRTYERAEVLKNKTNEQLKNLSLSYSTSDIDGMRGAGKIALDGALTMVPLVGLGTKLSKIERLENLADLAHKYPDSLLRNGDHLIDRKLQSNMLYKTGEYDYLYKTDDLGRLHEFHAEDLGATLRADRLPHDAETPGKLQGDHAGHLAGDRFGGSPEIDNLVSQLSNVNLSEYKKLENSWAKAIEKGEKVSVNVKINYEGDNLRPSSFEVKYVIDGEFDEAMILNRKRKIDE